MYIEAVNAKEFYLLLYSIVLTTLFHSPLDNYVYQILLFWKTITFLQTKILRQRTLKKRIIKCNKTSTCVHNKLDQGWQIFAFKIYSYETDKKYNKTMCITLKNS